VGVGVVGVPGVGASTGDPCSELSFAETLQPARMASITSGATSAFRFFFK
jgi:hypothetical protein